MSLKMLVKLVLENLPTLQQFTAEQYTALVYSSMALSYTAINKRMTRFSKSVVTF